MIALLCAVLLASNGSGKTLVRQQPGTMVPASGSAGALMSLGPLTPGCYASGAIPGPLTGWLNRTRGCWTGSAWSWCNANEVCVEPGGIRTDPLVTNPVTISEGISSWGTTASPTMVDNAYTAPDGTLTMEKMTCLSGASKYRTAAAGVLTSSTGPFTASIWVRADADTSVESVVGYCAAANNIATCVCGRDDGGACTATKSGLNCIVTSTVGTTPRRLWATFTCTSPVTQPSIVVAAGSFNAVGGVGGFWGGQIDQADHPRAYCPTPSSGLTATCLDQGISAVWPVSSGPWCAVVGATPVAGGSWAGITDRTLLAVGRDGWDNSLRIKADASGNLVFDVYDAASTAKTLTAAHGFAAGSRHEIAACSVSGTLTLYADGAPLAAAASGSGTGLVSSHPIAMHVGRGSSASTSADMLIDGARACRTSMPCRAGGAKQPAPSSGLARYVWAGMPREYRTNDVGLTTYTFTWPPDPVPTTAGTTVRRTAPLGSTAWTTENLSIAYPADWGSFGGARDLSAIYDRFQRRYYFAVNTIRSQAENFTSQVFSIFTSADGLSWQFVAYVGGIPGLPADGTGINNGKVWSPEWFVDDDGAVYVIVSANTGGLGRFEYHLHRALNDAFTSWSYVGKITGTALETFSAGQMAVIDPFLFKRDGTYRIVWKAEGSGGVVAAATIGQAAASSILGPYNTGGAISNAGIGTLTGEGPSVLEMPDGSANRFRIYVDDYTNKYAGTSVYVETNDWVTFSSTTSQAFIETDGASRHNSPVIGY